MRDGSTKKSKLSWSKSLVRKWFNIKSKTEEFQGGGAVHGGPDVEWRNSFSDREPSRIKKSRTEKIGKNVERVRRRRVDLNHPQIINVHNYSMFVATWNVGGKSPESNLNLDNFLHSSPPADIYVLGFQEIVPLNAGNILGAEDNGPAKKWLALISKTLNNLPGSSGGSGRYTPSPIPNPIAESDADFGGSMRQKASFFPRRSFQTACSWRTENDSSTSQPRLDRRYSVCDRVIFGHRPSDYDPNFRWGHRPSDSSWGHRPSDSSWSHRPSDSSWGHRPSDSSLGHRPSDSSWGHRPSDSSWCHRPSDSSSGHRLSDISCGHRPSDYSRWGSSDDDYGPWDSHSNMLFSPISNTGSAPMEDGYRFPGHSRYCLMLSKQMVGIFLTIWVKSNLKEHVRNIKVSRVGRGLMGYLGNKGSISVSLMLHQTSFCFVCSHLSSGQKPGDELRRNADVMEILKKTRFPRVHNEGQDKSPETILEHDRIIWLGDLNYRIALSYRSAKALVEMQNWRTLLQHDQLRIEQRLGRVFHGWNEGKIYFPPTYKYSNNSDRYAGDDMHPKEKRRTPAWCDRILWYGGGLHQLSYVRGESRFSDHRPVYSIFWAEVESYQGRLRRSMSCSSSRVVEELLPYSHGYTDLCFF
ncbi:type IV inositol polyphosphate 5-phosphatase 7-like [Diospyros lotus]|uniref:type IV inositol polyphosphate 5-phosphatase 7-like n=1 Tax=Diospyros lotus TaxID=55363 RepID=UPI00224DEE92|nr:type IV inositol polyphosphate 5-phosphatase 7-like [Diospyros lotus]XP_052206405.1 type IV inositol polyphosphate 5-phosphatase 7-like [Diospyros lotus]